MWLMILWRLQVCSLSSKTLAILLCKKVIWDWIVRSGAGRKMTEKSPENTVVTQTMIESIWKFNIRVCYTKRKQVKMGDFK